MGEAKRQMSERRYVTGKIPSFTSYEEEADFWDAHSFFDFPEETYPAPGTPEGDAYAWLRRQYPKRDGWIIATDPYTPELQFADFIVRNEREQVLVEVQTRRVLPASIARVKRLQKTFGATSALLLCTASARITDKTIATAQRSGVRIAWLPARRASRNSARRPLKVAESRAHYEAC